MQLVQQRAKLLLGQRLESLLQHPAPESVQGELFDVALERFKDMLGWVVQHNPLSGQLFVQVHRS